MYAISIGFMWKPAIETQLSNLAPMPDILDKTSSHYRQGSLVDISTVQNKSTVGRDHLVSQTRPDKTASIQKVWSWYG